LRGNYPPMLTYYKRNERPWSL